MSLQPVQQGHAAFKAGVQAPRLCPSHPCIQAPHLLKHYCQRLTLAD